MIDAGRFTRANIAPSDFKFDMDKAASVAQLRHFADEVEAGRIVLLRVQAGSVAQADGFTTYAVMIEYAEKGPSL